MFVSPFENTVSFAVLSSKELAFWKLHPQEAELVQKSWSPRRVHDFTLGRIAAKIALEGLGFLEPPPVLQGVHRDPLWPEGVAGSITHEDDLGICAVAKISEVNSLGIDLQRVGRKRQFDISARICHPQEVAWLKKSAESEWRMIALFSAKESVYKAFYPLLRYRLGFKDVLLSWDERDECFLGELMLDFSSTYGRGFSFRVRIDRADDYVLSSLLL